MKSVMTTFTGPCDEADYQPLDPCAYNISDGGTVDMDFDFLMKMFDDDSAAESEKSDVDLETVNSKLLTCNDPFLSTTFQPGKMMVPISGGPGCADSIAEVEVICEESQIDIINSDPQHTNPDPCIHQSEFINKSVVLKNSQLNNHSRIWPWTKLCFIVYKSRSFG